MNYTKINNIHKSLQKSAKKDKSESNKIFIRHWNVFYNQLRGRDLTVIEKTCHTPLYSALVTYVAEYLDINLDKIECDYAVDHNPLWVIRNSNLFQTFKEEVENE
jgi:hypothetical protein